MSYQNLAPAEFKAAFESADNAVIIDVRTPSEIAAGKIKGAIELDFFAPDFGQKVLALDKDKSYFIYCRSGNRSGQACMFLQMQGFANPVNLRGGMLAW
jgi:rhodanese-related sulfurtransferase